MLTIFELASAAQKHRWRDVKSLAESFDMSTIQLALARKNQ